MMRGRYCSFCSSVPQWMIVGPTRLRPMPGSTGARAAAYSSSQMTRSMIDTARPPCSIGHAMPIQPALRMAFCQAQRRSKTSRVDATRSSAGSSTRRSCGRLAASQPRNSLRNASCSAVYVKSMVAISGASVPPCARLGLCSGPTRRMTWPWAGPSAEPVTRGDTMKVVDAIAEILKRERIEFLSAYPTTPIIDSAAAAGIRPVLCRQERVGVGIADGFTRTTNGRRLGVFAMQYGPGAENAFPGVATAYSDSVPILVLPLGHQRDRAQVFPLFSSARTYASVTKWVETLNQPEQVSEVMRRAFNLLKMVRPWPVIVEIPADVAVADVADQVALQYKPVKSTCSAGNAQDIAEAAKVLLQARQPVINAGQGVLYAEASTELLELADLLQIPVMTTLEGKSAFPEDHPLALGTGGG